MADENSDENLMCYHCSFISTCPDKILVHTINTHPQSGTFSIRKRVFDENIGRFAYKSIHFSIQLSKLKSHLDDGYCIHINCQTRKISYKRRAQSDKPETNKIENSAVGATEQTGDSEIYKLLPGVVNILKDMGRFDDFLSLLQCISDGIITDNIALHLLLDVGNFYSKDSVSAIRYNDVSIDFWMTVNKLFKAKGVNFFRGYKAQGLISDDHPADLCPKKCRINFAVPSKQTLSKHFSQYNMNAGSPGLLNIPLDAFTSTNKGKDVKLSIDGKKVAIGLGELGDENLGGHEMQPTLQERKDRLHAEIDNLNNSASLLKDKISDGIAHFTEIEEQSKNVMKQSFLISITHMSKRIKELREFVVKRKIHLQNLMKMVDGDWKQSKLSGAISYWQTKLIQAQSHIGELLESIDKLGYAVACINGTSNNYILGTKGTILLQHQANYICLRETIPGIELGYEDCNITKQRTDKWMQLRQKCKVTGSTLYRALGLGTLREQQEHFDRVYKNIEKPRSQMVQSFLDHGTREEINAVGTLVGKILPVYFPQLSFREDGCEMINIGNSMAVISGDGTGISEKEDSVVAFEFKCPVPGKTYTTDLQYKIPTHYTTQILSQMAVKKCKSLAFISYTHESASYIHADINSNLWEQTKTFAEELYGTDNPPRPTRRNPNSKTLLADLKKYSDTCSFMAEFPALQAVPCSCAPADDKQHVYGKHGKAWNVYQDLASSEEVLSAVESSTKAIQQAYDLMRRTAKEVLVTVISDLERHANDESGLHGVPIHYGLSGFSLNMKVVRKILNEILLAVSEKELNVKAVAFDGQFLELSIEDDDGKALTICRLMKKHWEAVKKMDKKTI